MSLDAQDWVWNHSQSKGTARLVLLAIADKASGSDCSAYAGTTMLVRRSHAARSSVVVAVDRLIESGELEVVSGRTGPKGETRYRLPMARRHRRAPQEGGPESGPVQNPDPSEIRTPGGTESGPPRSEIRTPRGPKSGPQNAVNAVKRSGTQREGSRPHPDTTPAELSAPALSLIAPHWEPAAADRTAAAADIQRLGPKATANATAKFIRHHQGLGTRRIDFGPAWVTWLTRERADTQGTFLVGLPGGGTPTPTPPSYAERMAQLDAAAARDDQDTG